MSIAVSAVVKPSRTLLAMVLAMVFGIFLVAWMVGSGRLGDLSPAYRFILAGCCVWAAISGFNRVLQSGKTFHIDISGVGQIRIAETNVLAASGPSAEYSAGAQSGEVFELMTDSTIWPLFLILRLRSGDSRITVLPILRDSVSPGSFRGLSVACRWIAAHNIRLWTRFLTKFGSVIELIMFHPVNS